MTQAQRERELLDRVPTGVHVNGEWRDAAGGQRFDVTDPATGEVLTSVADATPDDARAALDAACTVADDWARTPSRERAELLRRTFDLVQQHATTWRC